MSERLWTGNFENREAFAAWAAQLAGDEGIWALLERVPNGWMTEEDRNSGLRLIPYERGLPIDQYECGCLFGSAYEVRWECSGATVSARYLGEHREDLAGENIGELDAAISTRRTGYALWGDRIADGLERPSAGNAAAVFATLRIPRLLEYPATQAHTRRVKLTVQEYRAAADHQPFLWRFAGIEET